jgi:hypothetical protein
MPNLIDLLSRVVPPGQHLSLTFNLFLLFHVLAGLTCVVTGAGAALSRKGHGRHPRFGTIYYWSLSVVFLTAAGMSVLRWPEDAYLLALGTTSFGLASIGLSARKIRWRGWRGVHILGMSLSYIVLFTAFYVDNGSRLPIWDRLPSIAYWTLPSLVGLPLLVRAVRRHTNLKDDLRATVLGLGRRASGYLPRRAV